MVIEGNMLTGQQLITLRLKENSNRDLPLIGQKEFQPTNSWLEKRQIQSALLDRKGLIEEERVEKWNALSSAEWLADMKKVKVTKKVGKLWENFGHYSDGSEWLYPEEALLLLETNALEVLYNELPLSIERGYVILINNETGCSLNEYRTFSHLVRLGYRLFRHSAQVTVTRYEKDIRLDRHILCQKNRNLPVVSSINSVKESAVNKSHQECDIVEVGSANVTNIDISSTSSTEKEKQCSSVVQLDNDESVTSSDILSVASKGTASKSDVAQPEKTVEICIEDDDIIEVPVDKEIVIINDATSSSESGDETDSDESSSESVGSKTSNSNWKRKSNSSVSCRSVRNAADSPPPSRYAIRTNYVTVSEFLFDSSQKAPHKDIDVIVLSDDDTADQNGESNVDLGQELQRFYKEIEVIDIDSDTDEGNRSSFVKNLSRKEILNSFPNYMNGEICVKIPSHLFLPPNIKPCCKEYRMKFVPTDSSNSYNDWTNHKLSFNNARNNARSSNYQNPRPYNRTYQTNRSRPLVPYYKQWNSYGNNTIQNQIRAMTTGMMQVASTILSSLPYSFTRLPSLMGNQQFYQNFSNTYQPMPCTNGSGFSHSNIPPLTGPYFNNVMMHQNSQYNNYSQPQSFSNRNESYGNVLYQGVNNQGPSNNDLHNNSMNDSFSDIYNRNIPQSNQQPYQNQRNMNAASPMVITDNDFDGRHQQINDSAQNRNYDDVIQNRDESYSYQKSEERNSENDRFFDNRSNFQNNDDNFISVGRNYTNNKSYNNNNSLSRRPYWQRPRRRYFDRSHARRPINPTKEQEIVIDTEGDPSVFVDDIPVKETDRPNQTEDEDFIPFGSSNSNTNNDNGDNIIDIGGNDFIVMDDIDNYNDRGKNWRPRRGRGRFHKLKRNRHPFLRFNKNKRYANKSDDSLQSTPNKRQKTDTGTNGSQLNKETDIEVITITDSSGPTDLHSNDNVISRVAKRMKEIIAKNKNTKRLRKRRPRGKAGVNQVNKNKGNPETIGLVSDDASSEEMVSIKTEGSDNVSIKVEKRNKNCNAENGLPHEVLENSFDSTINASTANCQSDVKKEPEIQIPNSTNVKVESSATIKLENTHDCPRPDLSCLRSSTLPSSPIKLESDIKSEKDRGRNVNIKVENSASKSVSDCQIKEEIDRSQVDSAPRNIKREDENISNANEVEVNEGNEERISRNNQTSLSQDENSEQGLSWAALKQKGSGPIPVNDDSMEVEEEQEGDDDEEEEEEDDHDDEIQSIITPKDCKTLGTVLSALQIIGRPESPQLSSGDSLTKLKISYDVYIPKNIPIKKASRGLPDYRLVIVDFRDPLPAPSQMAELSCRFQDGVPILIATVLPDSLSFFLIATVNLPTLDH